MAQAVHLQYAPLQFHRDMDFVCGALPSFHIACRARKCLRITLAVKLPWLGLGVSDSYIRAVLSVTHSADFQAWGLYNAHMLRS